MCGFQFCEIVTFWYAIYFTFQSGNANYSLWLDQSSRLGCLWKGLDLRMNTRWTDQVHRHQGQAGSSTWWTPASGYPGPNHLSTFHLLNVNKGCVTTLIKKIPNFWPKMEAGGLWRPMTFVIRILAPKSSLFLYITWLHHTSVILVHSCPVHETTRMNKKDKIMM